jgi:hypothetical protein
MDISAKGPGTPEDDQPDLVREEQELAVLLDELIAAAIAQRAAQQKPATASSAELSELTPAIEELPGPEESAGAQPETADVVGGTGKEREVSEEPLVAGARDTAPAQKTGRGTSAAAERRARPDTRASMREGLRLLFRSTAGLSAPGPSRGETTASSSGAPPQAPPPILPSSFLQRFIKEAEQAPEIAPSGLSVLDSLLNGGFGYGLQLISGAPGTGKTAFLESVAWEAVISHRPVIYYALREGCQGTWERLVCVLGQLLGGPSLSLSALRARSLDEEGLAALTSLDRTFQELVLPWLHLVEIVPAGVDTLNAFMQDVLVRSQQAVEQHKRTPLLLIDDLERLLLFTKEPQAPPVIAAIDEVLGRSFLPGVLSASAGPARSGAPTPFGSPSPLDGARSQVHLELIPVGVSADGWLLRLDLEVEQNGRTGWVGTVPLLLDRRSGVLATAGEPTTFL